MYTFESRVRYSETDASGRLTLEKLIDYFQDCSTFQSEENGVGVKAMLARGLAWIIVYWRVEIRRMPCLGELIRVGTLPYEMKGALGLRNFILETADGERLAAANSVWGLVETGSLRPVRIPQDVLARYSLGEKIPMVYDSRKIRLPELPACPGAEVTVREYHLDSNRHMNNGQYVRIAAGYLPADAEVRTLRIEYRRQALLGDRIRPVLYGAAACGQGGQSPFGKRGGDAVQADSICISLNAEDGNPYAVLEVVLKGH